MGRKLLAGATVWAGRDCAPAPGWLLIDDDTIAGTGGHGTREPHDAERIDLTGHHLLPGFVDTHTHLTVAAWHVHGGDASGWRGIGDALHAVRLAAQAAPDLPWLLFWNASLHAWPEGRLPTAAELDTAAPGRNVLVSGVDLHRGAASGPALSLAMERPHDLGRGLRGRLSGELWEAAYGVVLRKALADLEGYHDVDEVLLAETRRHLALGITHAHDPYVPPSAHERMHALRRRTPLRLSWATGPEDGIFDPPAKTAPEGPYGEAVREVKIFLDGGDRCALHLPVAALPGMIGGTLREAWRRRALGPIREGLRREIAFTGGGIELPYLRFDDATLVRVLAAYAAEGFALRLHTLGNLAAAQAARALTEAGVPAGTATLDHLTALDRRTADLIAAAGARTAVQPGFVTRFGGQFATTGLDRRLAIVGGRLLTDAGVPPVISSDHPCGLLDPLANLRLAVNRTFQPEQSLTRVEAVRAATTRAAASIGAPGAAGLTVGAPADLTICDGDPFTPATRVTQTWISGQRAH